jgi:cell division protein FtsB
MTIPKLKLPNIKFLNKQVVLVTIAVLVIFGLVGYGAVRQVQAQKADEVSAARAAEVRKAQQAAVTAKIASLESQNKALEGSKLERDLACSELRRLDTVRAITASVVVPAYCLR